MLFLLLAAHAAPVPWQAPVQVGDRSTGIVGTGDFNADGNTDVVYSRGNGFQWYAGPDFDGTVDEYDLGPGSGTSYGGTAVDINGDGWTDVIASDGARSSGPGELWLFLHPGNAADATSPWPRITIYSQDVWHQNDLKVADMDGDGRLDVVVRTRSDAERLVVALQNPDINSWTTRVWPTGETSNTPEGLGLGDLDNDGETEIVLSGTYMDNPGGWRTGDPTTHTIDPDFVNLAVKSVVADFDGDGQSDDVAICKAESGSADRTLSVYTHDGNPTGGASAWTETILESNVTDMHTLEVGDFDLDGHIDILAARAFGRSDILVYYGSAQGTWTRQLVSTDSMYVASVADLDGDGDLDFVGPRSWQGTVHAYENLLIDGPVDPPEAPTTLTGSVTDTTATLVWADTANETRFEIERAIGGGFSLVHTAPANATTWTDTGLPPDTALQYRVRAVNSVGTSAWTTVLDLRTDPPPPPDVQPPTMPTGIMATATDRRIDLMWTPSTDDRGVTGYRVEHNGIPASTTQPSASILGLQPDTSYAIRITALDAAGNESPSATLTVRTLPEPDLQEFQLAHWTLDESSGTSVSEQSNQWPGTLVGPESWIPDGQIGSAIRLDGTQRIDLGPVDLGDLDQITIAAWVRIASLDGFGDEARFISKATGVNGPQHTWMLGNYEDGTALRFRLNVGGSVLTLISAEGALPLDTWVHVAGTYDGSAMEIWVDGAQVGQLSASGVIPANPSVSAALGNQPAGAGDRGLDGWLDDVHLFEVALSADELVSLAAGPPCQDDDDDGVCNDADFLLSQTPIVSRQPMTFTADRAPAGSTVFFLVSPALGAPTCHPVATTTCTPLRRPTVVGTAVADATGTASLTVQVPNLPAGITVHSQAAWFDGPTGDVTQVRSTTP